MMMPVDLIILWIGKFLFLFLLTFLFFMSFSSLHCIQSSQAGQCSIFSTFGYQGFFFQLAVTGGSVMHLTKAQICPGNFKIYFCFCVPRHCFPLFSSHEPSSFGHPVIASALKQHFSLFDASHRYLQSSNWNYLNQNRGNGDFSDLLKIFTRRSLCQNHCILFCHLAGVHSWQQKKTFLV